jgi:DNA-binding transcriptional ArsR family regulator
VCRPRPDCAACPVTTWCADPGVYVAPRPQGRFEGSGRQARGAIVRALAERGVATRPELVARTGLPLDRIEPALTDLEAEGLVERIERGFRLGTGQSD